MNYSAAGLLKCARYSFAPNQLHYCGPEKQADLKAYVSLALADGGLGEILNRFDTLYKYLVFIASENGYKDPFDPRVVEAYWLGNSLLNKKNVRALAAHLSETLSLKKKLTAKQLSSVIMRSDGGFPHHTFHVLNIYRRTGHLPISHTLETMDNCRISWGKVIGKENGNGNTGQETYLYIMAVPLVHDQGKLKLGLPKKRQIFSLLKNIKVGDWVSFHWGVVCEKISPAQKQQLNYYTRKAIDMANSNV